MPQYKIYNFVISSDNPIPGIPSCRLEETDIWIRWTSTPKPIQILNNCFIQWYLPDGGPWLSVSKTDEGYLLRFNKLADFFVSSCGAGIVCMPNPEIPSGTIHHLLLDQVIPLVINLKGNEALHASAILTPQGVVAFAGQAGAGKSTLAGDFLKAGYTFMSDDCLTLLQEGPEIFAIPAYPGLRLWEDAAVRLFGRDGSYKSVAHYTTKQRVSIEWCPRTYCAKPQPIRRVYALAFPSEAGNKTDIIIEPLSKRDGFMELITYAFRLDTMDHNMLRRQFHFIKQVASTVSVRRLIFPRDLSLLPTVREAILNDLQDMDN